jgi:hypothetical protein
MLVRQSIWSCFVSECSSRSINIDSGSFERVEDFRYLRTNLTNQNSIQEEIRSRLKSGNALYVFLWVFPRRQIVICRRFGTLCQFHLQRLGVEYDVWMVRGERGIYTRAAVSASGPPQAGGANRSGAVRVGG